MFKHIITYRQIYIYIYMYTCIDLGQNDIQMMLDQDPYSRTTWNIICEYIEKKHVIIYIIYIHKIDKLYNYIDTCVA